MVEEDNAPTREQRDAIIQRVRVGLTGLAAVFLLTLLAASIFSLLGQDEQHGARLANGAAAPNIAASEDPPKEPLAELGVAPGGNLPKTTPAPAQPGTSSAAGTAFPPVAAGRPEASPAPRG